MARVERDQTVELASFPQDMNSARLAQQPLQMTMTTIEQGHKVHEWKTGLGLPYPDEEFAQRQSYAIDRDQAGWFALQQP